MKKNTAEYREWKKRQDAKKLRLRTKRKKKRKSLYAQRTLFERELKASPEYNAKTHRLEFKAPTVFSIVENPAETIDFFNRIISFMTKKKTVSKELFIDIRDVTILRTDALMYLLAIMNNHDPKYDRELRFSGNEPSNANVKKKFQESGFYNYVRPRGIVRLNKDTDNIQIVSGEDCDTENAKRVSDFVCKIAGISKRRCGFLYNTMIELMSNTHKHAYNDSGVLKPIWYCFAEHEGDGTISFTFMDTGSGIPSTVSKNFSEKVNILRLKEENRYVISALDGEFRTSTKMDNRGKGLPKIREFRTKDSFKELHIVSNKADVQVGKNDYVGRDMDKALQGTLYYWSIDIDKLKGAVV